MYSGPAIGIWNSPNPFSETPGGTLEVADNVVFQFPGVLSPRRGWDFAANYFGDGEAGPGPERADSFAFYGNGIILAYDESVVAWYNGSSFSDLVDRAPVSSTNRMRFVGAARCVFFNTFDGLFMYDGASTFTAGGQRPTLLTAAPSYNASGWMEVGTTVAYRYTICYKDAFGRVIESAPSERVIFNNGYRLALGDGVGTSAPTVGMYSNGADDAVLIAFRFLSSADWTAFSGAVASTYSNRLTILGPSELPNLLAGVKTINNYDTSPNRMDYTGDLGDYTVAQNNLQERIVGVPVNVSLRAYLPDGVTTSHFLRIYRSDAVALNDEPSDSMYLGYESPFFTSGQITTGYIDITDSTPEDFLDTPLYTNGKITQSNYRMPQALDIVYWAERMWAANLRYHEFQYLNLLGVGSGNGIQVGDVIQVFRGNTSLPSVTIVGVAEGTESGASFGVYTSSDAGTNIERTAKSIVAAINRNTPGTTGSIIFRASQPIGSVTANQWLTQANTPMTGSRTQVAFNFNAWLYDITVTGGAYVAEGGSGHSITFTTEKNAVATAMTATEETNLAGSLSASSSNGQQAVTAGDLFSMRFTNVNSVSNTTAPTGIVATIRFINVVNPAAATKIVDAFYVSSGDDAPGKILLVSTEYESTSADEYIAVCCSRPLAFSPNTYAIDTPTFKASDCRRPAGLAWSALGLPESFPLLNVLDVNSPNNPILRIFPLNYRLIIFKNDGIYSCTNVEPFSLQRISEYILIAPNSVHVLEDKLYALTNQGMVTISDAGLVELSEPINRSLLALMTSDNFEELGASVVGFSYPTERLSILSLPDGIGESTNSQQFVYSAESKGFTRWDLLLRFGVINPTTNAMWWAPEDANRLREENKELDDDDFYDGSRVVGTFDSLTNTVVTLSANVDGIVFPGDMMSTSGDDEVEVVSVDGVDVTMASVPNWTIDQDVTAFRRIQTEVKFNKLTGGVPADLKTIKKTSFLFRRNTVDTVEAEFSSEVIETAQTVDLVTPSGDSVHQIHRVEPIPQTMTQCCQLSVGFTTEQAKASFEFLGIDVKLAEDSDGNYG